MAGSRSLTATPVPAHLASVTERALHLEVDEAVEVALPRSARRPEEDEREHLAVVVHVIEYAMDHPGLVVLHAVERLRFEGQAVEPLLHGDVALVQLLARRGHDGVEQRLLAGEIAVDRTGGDVRGGRDGAQGRLANPLDANSRTAHAMMRVRTSPAPRTRPPRASRVAAFCSMSRLPIGAIMVAHPSAKRTAHPRRAHSEREGRGGTSPQAQPWRRPGQRTAAERNRRERPSGAASGAPRARSSGEKRKSRR